ncbi:hypothetical protein [Stenotrophomonas sp.]|uniref:hypothetical protein n=1 Tax=Stenotrophomonas sp. TaxID=69392 RepID=UPI0028AC3799|nr:hypothetical protein [Stenotrophomonas sp.]
MSSLLVRVDNATSTDLGPAPELFARIQKLDAAGRAIAEQLHASWVPVSSDPNSAREISLPAGDYLVEVTMPSGELLSQAVQLSGTRPYDLVLVPTSSLEPAGRWQQLMSSDRLRVGIIPKSQYKTQSQASVSAESGGRQMQAASIPRARGDAEFALPRRVPDVYERVGLHVHGDLVAPMANATRAPWAADRTASINVGRPLHWFGNGNAGLSVDVLRTNPWTALPAIHGATANIIEVLNARRTEYLVLPFAENEDAAIFSVDVPVESKNSYEPKDRVFAAVHRRMGVELICLPTPWRNQWTGREVPMDVKVQQPKYESEFASAVSVRDPQLSFLLGFLQSGALPAAKQLAEHSSALLYEKGTNPLAAAAGGYALVSGAVDSKPQRWHRWIENLMHRFEHVPDGAVQYAMMRLRLRKSRADVEMAAEAFKMAYRRGLPFYGMGMRWLLEGLDRLAPEDAEAKWMAAGVRQLTSRLHPSSAFTILRIGKT